MTSFVTEKARDRRLSSKARGLLASAANLTLRGSGLGGKLVLLVLIGRYLGTAELGVYGLFSATTTIMMFVLGLDFYAFNTREMLARPMHERGRFIRDQMLLHLVTYAIVLIPVSLLVVPRFLPASALGWFFIVAVLEHLSQELYRLLVTLQRQTLANAVLFVRAGLWVVPVCLLWALDVPGTRRLEAVWIGWSAGSLASVAIALLALRASPLGAVRGVPVAWGWILSGVGVSVPFFLSTVFAKLIDFADRYMIDWWRTKEEVGVYSLYANLANGLNHVVFTLVVIMEYPALIEACYHRPMEEYRRRLRGFTLRIAAVSVAASLLLVAGLRPIVSLTGRAEIAGDLDVCWILIAANLCFNLAYAPHYHLYAHKRDLRIMWATAAACGVNIALNALLIPVYGIRGAAAATMASMAGLLLAKWILSRNLAEPAPAKEPSPELECPEQELMPRSEPE